ncbi:MAG TPA: LLM class flavin-dependent oxidoreductase [Candidatus Udaeobacter sp.]|jgi:FMN-dependent oxidoreductase (nitrilotriacetate monooxygenase family)|nr:LLM class flavin-dependent oxidoreductase [Candidatus Udaeobacter sp.]
MSREIRLNAFDMNCVGHQSPGLWTHPRDISYRYKDLEYWTELAQILERGKFDGLFIADVLGVYDVYHGSAEHAIRQAAQIPLNEPMLLVPAMAHVTKHLGFGVTCSLTYEHPYPFARRISTLDHLTDGRAGWNIVSSYLDSAARNFGLDRQHKHDDRYEVADEYMEVCYKLWEGSWEDDAVVRDRARKLFTDPEKVHEIQHYGKYFTVPGFHLCEPSPQRTPVLYQAGASRRGKDFAARHAECVFVAAPSKKVLKDYVRDIRQRAAGFGRDPSNLIFFNLFTVIVAPTESEAQAKYDDYKQYVSYDGALALVSGWTGIDFGKYNPDDRVEYIENDAVQSATESLTTSDPDKIWTVREVANWVGIGGLGPVVVGSPSQVADALQGWAEETGVDGFNLAYAVTHETFRDFVDLVVPELQRRGVYKKEYRPGTLREKLFGQGARLSEEHPGAAYRIQQEQAALA